MAAPDLDQLRAEIEGALNKMDATREQLAWRHSGLDALEALLGLVDELRARAEQAAQDQYEACENAVLVAVSGMFPDFDFTGCYDLSDLLSHAGGQAEGVAAERDAAVARATQLKEALREFWDGAR